MGGQRIGLRGASVRPRCLVRLQSSPAAAQGMGALRTSARTQAARCEHVIPGLNVLCVMPGSLCLLSAPACRAAPPHSGFFLCISSWALPCAQPIAERGGPESMAIFAVVLGLQPQAEALNLAAQGSQAAAGSWSISLCRLHLGMEEQVINGSFVGDGLQAITLACSLPGWGVLWP